MSALAERLDARAPWWRTAWPLALRLVVGIVFVWSGITKLDPLATARSVRMYQLMPEWGVTLMATGLPILEIAVGVLLLLGLGTRIVSVITSGLFAMFVFGITSVWIRGLSIDCGCFGGGSAGPTPDHFSYTWHIVLDGLGAVAMLALVWWPASRFSLDGLLGLFPAPAAPVIDEEPVAPRA